MKKILIPLDLRSESVELASYGYSFKTSPADQVILLHVISDNSYYSFPDYSPILGYMGNNDVTLSGTIDVETKTLHAQNHLARIAKKFNDPNLKTHISTGEVSKTIVEEALLLRCTLIVMGFHKHHGIEKVILSNIAQQVLNHSPLPILIYPFKQNN